MRLRHHRNFRPLLASLVVCACALFLSLLKKCAGRRGVGVVSPPHRTRGRPHQLRETSHLPNRDEDGEPGYSDPFRGDGNRTSAFAHGLPDDFGGSGGLSGWLVRRDVGAAAATAVVLT